MLVSEFIDYLEQHFPDIDFYDGTIDKNSSKCIGIYTKEGQPSHIALGGLECTSFNSKRLSILIHWTENANLCESTATSIYNFLFGVSDILIGNRRVASIQMLDSGPISIQRDENNICEMVVRINIIYDREVTA